MKANQIIKTQGVNPKDLIKGDEVIYYNTIFIITEDPRKTHHEGGKTYYAPCKIKEEYVNPNEVESVLNNYNGFQGNDLRIVCKIIK